VSEPVTEALTEALTPLVRRLAREEVHRATLQWRWRTPAEAAELLGISAGAVRQRINRGQLDLAIRNGRYDGRQLQDC
jgi:hypothetical protein